MNFLKQYIKIINYALMGLVFAFASFYLLSNAYHYLEIRKDFITDFSAQPLTIDFKKKLQKVSTNVANFNANTYKGNMSVNQMQVIHQNLKTCLNSFNNPTIQEMMNKKVINIIDVYKLNESYENDILSQCIVNSLYWTTTITETNFNSPYLVNNANLMKLYVNSLLNDTSYLKKDLLNNSSYFYSTSISSSSIKSNTKDGFYEVMGAYSKAASYVEFISNWFNKEVEENHE